MSKPVKEYSGLPFDLALGEAYGMRLWKVDKYGRLRARNWSSAGPWRPGVNEAKCLAEPGTSFEQIIDPTGRGRRAVEASTFTEPDPRYGASVYSLSSSPGISASYPVRTRYRITWNDGRTESYDDINFNQTTNDHESPSESCTCGFYAYTDMDHAELDGYLPGSNFAFGIIKATGRTLIGTKGFRTEKAEIVALLDPTSVSDDKAQAHQKKLIARVYDVPLLPSREALLEFAPVEPMFPDPSTDEFWNLP